jgi:hypothetical protein
MERGKVMTKPKNRLICLIIRLDFRNLTVTFPSLAFLSFEDCVTSGKMLFRKREAEDFGCR